MVEKKTSLRFVVQRMMFAPLSLNSMAYQNGKTDEDEALLADGVHIYIGDDLTKARANLAFKARQAKRNKEISDTWVIDAKVMVKNNYAKIFNVTSIQDLDRVKSQR